LPFLVAGTIKASYDLVLWRWFRGVTLPDEIVPAAEPSTPTSATRQVAAAEEDS